MCASPSVLPMPVCLCLVQVSSEVFLPHSACLLAPCLARALLPESPQGQLESP